MSFCEILQVSRNKFSVAVSNSGRIHTCSCHLKQSRLIPAGNEYKNINSSLWWSTLPARVKNAFKLADQKKVKLKNNFFPCGPLLIQCKNEKLNHYKGTGYKKFATVPLASKGWHHRKSRNDHFIILPSKPNPAFLHKEQESTAADSFEALGTSVEIVDQLKKLGITSPTNIQARAIPKLLAGRNALISAETGSGKTLAYAIPMLQHILKWKPKINPRLNSPLGLIVAPSRELASQIGEVVSNLGQDLDIKCQTVLANQTKKFLLSLNEDNFDNVDVVVATLGVMCKLTYHNVYSLENCVHIVMDEADTLLDDSFNEKSRVLLKRCKLNFEEHTKDRVPRGALISFVSATIPRDVDEILSGILPARVLDQITTDNVHRVQPHVSQKFIRCRKFDKPKLLLGLVRNDITRKAPVIIFSNNTDTCNWIRMFLDENNIACARLHTSSSLSEREWTMENFRNGTVNVVSCTDVMSRGLDIERVRHVINYDFPRYMADYVHRSGRTGRIGSEDQCEVTSLISSRLEVDLVQNIELAVRRDSDLPRVNNNITKLLRLRYS